MGVSPISGAPSFQQSLMFPCIRHGRDARGTVKLSVCVADRQFTSHTRPVLQRPKFPL